MAWLMLKAILDMFARCPQPYNIVTVFFLEPAFTRYGGAHAENPIRIGRKRVPKQRPWGV